MFNKNLNAWVIEQVAWAEKNLKGKTGAEKKAAVIKKVDDLIKLPFYLEWMDDMVIGYLVDVVCKKFNAIGENLADITPDQADVIKEELEDA